VPLPSRDTDIENSLAANVSYVAVAVTDSAGMINSITISLSLPLIISTAGAITHPLKYLPVSGSSASIITVAPSS